MHDLGKKLKFIPARYTTLAIIMLMSLFSLTLYSPAYCEAVKYGQRHPSWSDGDIKNFISSVDTALKSGGKILLRDGWEGVWNAGSKSYSARNGTRIEYRTKSRFTHPRLTNGKTATIQVYFWKYHSKEGVTAKLRQLVNYYNSIQKISDRYTSYSLVKHNKLGFGDESHLFSVKLTSANGKTKARYSNTALFATGAWLIYVSGARDEESVKAALTALYKGQFENGSLSQNKLRQYEPSAIGYADPSKKSDREDFVN
jgi:hypothetical protein